MIKLKQAVIFCGGLGTRLRPITDKLPKPLAPVNNIPFLDYLLRQLQEQGIKKVLLLIGYKANCIKEYILNNPNYLLIFDFCEGPQEWETGTRLWNARNQLEDEYLLLYSDNYASFSLKKSFKMFRQKQSAICLLLYPKKNGNVSIDNLNNVEKYDPSRSSNSFKYVEVGYMIMNKNLALKELNRDSSLTETIVKLVNQGKVSAIVNSGIYHSISDPTRLKITEEYLKPKKILLIDRDGTINIKAPMMKYISNINDFKFIDSTLRAMEYLSDYGFSFIVITNQAGIARGLLSSTELEQVNQYMCSELKNKGINILDIYICPHHWDDECLCRKPAPGLILEASKDYNLWLDHTYFVGDDPRDIYAAKNAGTRSIIIGDQRRGCKKDLGLPDAEADHLYELAPWIVQRYESLRKIYDF